MDSRRPASLEALSDGQASFGKELFAISMPPRQPCSAGAHEPQTSRPARPLPGSHGVHWGPTLGPYTGALHWRPALGAWHWGPGTGGLGWPPVADAGKGGEQEQNPRVVACGSPLRPTLISGLQSTGTLTELAMTLLVRACVQSRDLGSADAFAVPQDL